ncbi:hypothetical protein EV715DRAFT_248669, partial [Schizophyllum commune]
MKATFASVSRASTTSLAFLLSFTSSGEHATAIVARIYAVITRRMLLYMPGRKSVVQSLRSRIVCRVGRNECSWSFSRGAQVISRTICTASRRWPTSPNIAVCSMTGSC